MHRRFQVQITFECFDAMVTVVKTGYFKTYCQINWNLITCTTKLNYIILYKPCKIGEDNSKILQSLIIVYLYKSQINTNFNFLKLKFQKNQVK